MPYRVREIPVQREHCVPHQGIHPEMEPLHRLPPAGDALESVFELGEILHLDHQMEFPETRRTQAELAARQPPALDQPLGPQMTKIGIELLGEDGVADLGLEVAPDVVDVHDIPQYTRNI